MLATLYRDFGTGASRAGTATSSTCAPPILYAHTLVAVGERDGAVVAAAALDSRGPASRIRAASPSATRRARRRSCDGFAPRSLPPRTSPRTVPTPPCGAGSA
jgi:hypothetical protein